MSKSLKTIQIVMKVLRILLKIAFVFVIIGAIVSAVMGGYSLASDRGMSTILDYEIEGTTIKEMIVEQTGMGLGISGAYFIASAIICIGSAVQIKMQSKYFDKELDDGTPFTFEGADALKKAALNSLIACVVTILVAGITFSIMTFDSVGTYTFDSGSGLIFSPLTMLFGSVIFRYGAEQRQVNNKE